MASIRDVAKKANVGATTVSRVLNGNGYVSRETRKKIEKAMKELDYTPNELARNLFHKKTGIVALLVPDAGHPFFAELVRHMEVVLYEKGYKTMLCDTFRKENYELEYLDMVNRHIVDGIITGVHTLKIEAYMKITKPIVAFDRYLGDNIPVVGVDHAKGGKKAAELLIRSGCKNVLQFEGSRVINSPSHERHVEFARVMREHRIPVQSFELKWNEFDPNYYEEVTKKVFAEHPEVDGVFGADLLAVYYMKEALRNGRRIPEDLKIVAYDGTYVTKAVTPSLTSIVQPVPEIARELVETICGRIEGREYSGKRTTLGVGVYQGETTIR